MRRDATRRDATRSRHDTDFLTPPLSTTTICLQIGVFCVPACVCMYVCMYVRMCPGYSAGDQRQRCQPSSACSPVLCNWAREREREREHFLNACVAAAVTLIVLPNRQVRLARSRRWPFVRCNRYEAQRQPATCRHRPLRHVFKNV